MPANKQTIKQYAAQITAGAANTRISPQNDLRTFLLIQNTGMSPGVIRFGEPTQPNSGGDIVLGAGAFSPVFDIPDTCPKEAINCFSALGTTFAIVEGTMR